MNDNMGNIKKTPDFDDSIDSLFKSPINIICDSPDPFEELQGNKNINFSRSRSYYDLNLYGINFTPTKPKVFGKENFKSNPKHFSSVGKKMARKNCNSKIDKMLANKSDKFKVSNHIPTKECSSIASKSPCTPSHVFNSKVIQDSRRSSLKYTPVTPLGLLANGNTPNNKIYTPKYFSLQKVELAAQKDCDYIERVIKQKKLEQLNQAKRNCSSSCSSDNKNAEKVIINNGNASKQIIPSVHLNTNDNIEDDEDLPCTQPITSILLRGVVAYVEMRCGKDCISNGIKAELISLGAKVEKNFTKKVTHCLFQSGRMSTYRRAVEGNIPLVSTLWIEACKAELCIVPCKGYEPYGLDKYKEELPLYKLKTKSKRPMTDSKVPARIWKKKNKDETPLNVVDKKQLPLTGPPVKKTTIIDALHSVAGDFKKATNQFQEILTSPVLMKTVEKFSGNSSQLNKRTRKSVSKKHNKKLVFPSSSEDEQNIGNNQGIPVNPAKENTDNSVDTIRVSYDSDDLLVYAKKQASSVRCSAPAKLLTSKKIKKLLHSCQHQSNENKDTSKAGENGIAKKDEINVKGKRTRKTNGLEKNLFILPGSSKKTKINDKSRKRKLILPNQVISNFRQDSEESASDMSPLCPYKESPNKRVKSAIKEKTSKPLFRAIFSDCDSDDSLARAARRESSALFVKKEKKVVQKRTPSIVCTSLQQRDTQVVSAIVSRLGRFTIEPTVTENTTHVVTSSPRRTINLLKAIARGCWVLHVKWVYESLESGQWLHEERFEYLEFSLSVQIARKERQAFGPVFGLELFKGLGLIYVCRTTKAPASDLVELIRLCGGTVVSSARVASIVVGPAVPFSPSGRQPPLVVSHKWVLDCISRLSQLNPHDYIVNEQEP